MWETVAFGTSLHNNRLRQDNQANDFIYDASLSPPYGAHPEQNSAGANSTRSAIGVGNNIHGHPRSFSGSNSPCPVEIVNTMPASEIIQHLVEHQCPDITKFLDLASCGEHPVSGGGFGDIYRARLLDGVQVAIKCARFPMDSRGEAQSALKRSAHELYVWSRCQHRNLLQLFGFAEFRGRIAMVSPWMDNGNLSEYVSRNPQVDRCRLCVEVAEGLTYLHSMGSVHGDLKASNVFVSREGVVKLADFGNTRLQNYTLGFARSAEGWCISLRWTAPELLGEQPEPLSRETDVYALGMTVLEIITGRLPYSDLSEHAVMVAVALRKARPKRPYGFIPSESDAGEALWWMLNLCWAADPKNRPDAFSVRDALIGITQEGLMARDSYIMVD